MSEGSLYLENMAYELAYQIIDQMDNASIRSYAQTIQNKNILNYMKNILENRYSMNFHQEYPPIDRSEFTTDPLHRVPDLRFIGKPAVAPPNGALAYFINEGDFGPADLDDPKSPKLTDLLPLAKQGIAYSNTWFMLFLVYTHYNNLRNGNIITSDDVMMEAFGGIIPCLYNIIQTGTKIVEMAPRETLEIMREENPVFTYVYNDDLLNTYQAIAQNDPEFNPKSFDTASISDGILKLNIFRKRDLEEIDNLSHINSLLQDNQIKTQLMLEYNLVKNLRSNIYRKINATRY